MLPRLIIITTSSSDNEAWEHILYVVLSTTLQNLTNYQTID